MMPSNEASDYRIGCVALPIISSELKFMAISFLAMIFFR